MDISKKQHLPTNNIGEDQADGTFEDDKDKALDEMDGEADNASEQEDVNDEDEEEEQDRDSDKDKA